MEYKNTKKPWLIVLIILMGTVSLFLLFFRFADIVVIRISHQESGELYLQQEAEADDRLTFTWIHSFEHIPWIEEYTIGEDNTFVLNTIRVAGFGAGIPENKGTVSFEEGMVVMKDINETFESFAWINSQSALVSILLNDTVLIQGSQLPHHQRLALTLQGKRTLCPRFPSKR